MVARAERRPAYAESIRDVYRRTGLAPAEGHALYTVHGEQITSAWPLLAVLADREGPAAALAYTQGDEAAHLDRVAVALGLCPDFVRGFAEGYTSANPTLTEEDMLLGMAGTSIFGGTDGSIDEPAEVDLFESGMGWTEGLNCKITVLLSPTLFSGRAAR